MEQIQTNIVNKITKDMIISDILDAHPDKARSLSEIMMEFGIHCVGCGASGFETLEEGVLGHGFSEEELNNLIVNLNKVVETKEKKIKQTIFSLKLSDKAIKKLKAIMKDEKKQNRYLRAAVLTGGCSGYSYDLEIVDKKAEGDILINKSGLKILVNNESAELLNGTIIDFVDTLNESGFKFDNPNATKECGCGKSFS